ncbi:MAG: amino acid adenylation domain-containing protein [Nostoc sp. ChiSLP02]|nr:amino acid adenylation domain-containing protein [Nostoc sp. DedSLP05]MDZ8102886.1 amino acid adenylation domain-containing protein [Nostoc sp. DedSLP01]MDZ8184103.1 amino acid adenylation domain-containing protein [Nostoc sp. ChiSLP02]
MSVKNKNIQEFYPLSPMQQGILFHSLAAPESGVYFEQLSWTLEGKLNIREFHRAWQYVIERHAILRTSFVWEGLKEPVQIVHRQVVLPWQEYDWQHLSSEEQQQKLELFWQSDLSRGFELTQPPLMRLTLIQLSDISYNFTWSHHHILLDGWSIALVLKEVFDCYKAFSNGQNVNLEPIRPYRDYIVWLQQENLSEAETFWRQTLKGFTTPTQLSVNKGARKLLAQIDASMEREVKLSVATTAKLQSLAKQYQLTLNTIVQGAWALLLSRYSGQEDVVFGAVTSGRPPTLAKVESMVGLLINTLPIRVQISPEEFLLPWLEKIKNQLVEARQYEYSPLVKIQEWSEVPKDLSLFESIVVFENYPIDASLRQQNINLEIKGFHSFEKTNYPIRLTVIPGEELSLKISYDDGDRFDTDSIARMLGHLQTLLEGIVANPQQRLCELSLLTEIERHQLLVEWNDTQVEYPQDCIHELFEAQVEKTPDAVAVVFENEQLTYRELNAKANQLAHYLQQLGVKPEVLVGIYVERSLDMAIGVLGILKAGGAYVPIDPAYPQERIAFMLEDTQVSVLLTQESLFEQLPENKARVICLDKDWENIANTSEENLVNGVTIANLAYVIYTSGSTGRPKGICLPQRSLMNLLQWHFSCLYTGARTLQFASLSFDASFHEIFATWGTGGTLFILSENLRMDAVRLGQFLSYKAIEKMILPVVVLKLLAELVDEQGITPLHTQLLGTLREITTTGEQLQITQPIIKLFKFLKHCSLHNHYGPSETHVVTALSLENNPDEWTFYPSIGKPIANTQIYILDRQFNPVPLGVSGELYIGGVSLAQGYLNRPDLTAEKFIPDPISNKPDARLYKTGDLARYLPDGNIEYLGRIDDQVKIRGFRIELGEIEAVLSQHPAVREVVVLDRKDEADNKRLVAYVVSNDESTSIGTELRCLLHDKLPNYMVPSAFIFLEALPLTPNGKVNRRALPIPNFTQPELERTFTAPRTAAEEIMAQIWGKVLGIEKVGIYDNFFELGGHSLMTTRVISQIRQVFQVELPIRSLFKSPTIEGLVNTVTQIWGTHEVVEEIARTWKELEQIPTDEVKKILSQEKSEIEKLKNESN